MEQALYDLPDGWKKVFVDDVCTKITDGAHKTPKYTDDGVPFLSVKDVNKGLIDFSNTRFVSQETHNDLYRRCNPERNDILYTKVGSTGVAKVVDTDREFGLFVSVALLKPKPEIIDSKYFEYALNSPSSYAQSQSLTRGVANRNLVLKDIKSISFCLAPIGEQKRLVEKLDALLTRIDTAIEHLQESVTLADALSKNGLSEIFEGLKNSCEVVPLSSVVKINSGIALPKIFKNGFSDGEIPFFKVAQMNNHHENMIEPEITFNETVAKEHKLKLFPKGSTLIPKRGGAILTNKKRILLEDASYDSNIMGLKANESKISDDYLFAFMRTIDLANFVDASTIPQINNKHIDQMQIPLASIEEQADVVSRVNLLVKKVESVNSQIQSQLNDFLALKNSILDSAFKGEL